ncbi:MAG: tetratricopeptide repeat protein [Alphaproteobacteria bacterium]|nr:tetratricopeptide repeat protein [Alphaproteobacteria bacterium]
MSKLQRITIIAAEQGNANAQYNLGLMYHEGKAVPQNDKSAVMWFTRAAEQGNSNAQFNLGLMYAFGYGVPKNYIYAHMWLNIAAIDEDVLGANLLRDDLEKNMTPSEISAARERASECVRKNYKER